jgi:hypothetical protein
VDSTQPGKKNTIYESRNQRLFYKSTSSFNHSGLGQLVYSSACRRYHPNKSSPQEKQRLRVPRAFREKTIHNLNEHVHGCVDELVFNLGEVGIADWEDWKARNVIVPVTMRGQATDQRISRNVNHISVIACVSTSGESLITYTVTSQDSVPVQEQLKKHGVRFGTELILKSNRKPYVKAEIFLDCVQTVFLPSLSEFRTLDEFTEEFAVLLMARYSSQLTADVIGLLTEARVHVITFAPHTAQIFQILDVTRFGVPKQLLRYELIFEDEKATVEFIMKVYHDFKQTMVEPNT